MDDKHTKGGLEGNCSFLGWRVILNEAVGMLGAKTYIIMMRKKYIVTKFQQSKNTHTDTQQETFQRLYALYPLCHAQFLCFTNALLRVLFLLLPY